MIVAYLESIADSGGDECRLPQTIDTKGCPICDVAYSPVRTVQPASLHHTTATLRILPHTETQARRGKITHLRIGLGPVYSLHRGGSRRHAGREVARGSWAYLDPPPRQTDARHCRHPGL